LGPGVQHIKAGDRVAVNNVVGCGKCPACHTGRFVRCQQRPNQDVNNGFGELVIAPERNCLVLDNRLDFETGCLVFDNWGTPFCAVNLSGAGPRDEVLISGCGPIGLGAIVIAKLRGSFIIAVDPLLYRRQTALRLGADLALAPGEDTIRAVHDLTSGAGASIVIECSGKAPAYPVGLGCLRVEGTFVSVGELNHVDFSPSEFLIRNNLRMQGSWYSTMYDGHLVQDLILQSKIEPKAFISHRISLPELPGFFGKVCDFAEDVLKTVILMPA